MQLYVPFAKDGCFDHCQHSPSNCSLRRQETSPRQKAELSLPQITHFPASSREAPKSHPLFLKAGQGDSTIQGQGEIREGPASTPQLCKSDIQGRRAGPRPAPVPVSSSFISSWSPTFQPPPLSKRCFPRAVSAALKVPDCLLFLNLKSNLKRIFRHSFSHLHRTFLIKIKQALVSRVFKGLRSKLRERKSIPPHHSTSSRAIVLPPSPRPGAGVSRFSSRIRDHHPARTPPPSLRVERKAPLPFRGCHGSGNAPSSSARSGCGGREASGCRGSARVWRSAVFKGEPLPALPPASWVSPLAPQGAREAPAGAKPRLRSPLRASCAPSAGSGSALLGALQARRVVSPKREAPTPGLRAGTTCRRCHLCLVWGASSGGAWARGGWEGGECGRCARERVCACVRARVCGGCARRGRRWRSLRPGSAPAGEGLQGLAPLELGICGRSLSILVES